MPIPISAQGVAEKMLEILVREIRLKAGQDVPDQQLKQRYRAHSHDAGDLTVGFEYAHEHGWLEYDSTRKVFRLTEDGYQYAL
jgi:hypothetical protein